MIFQSETAYSISSMLTDIGLWVTNSVTWVSEFVGAITSNKLILGFVLVALIGTGIGVINRLIHV